MTTSVRQWRVPGKVPIGKLLVAGVVLLLGVFGAQVWWQFALAGLAAAALVAWALRDLMAPVRLAADHSGLALRTGFARWQRVPWRTVERVRVDVRRRSRMLEIDVGDHLYLFSRYDVDADLDEVVVALEQLRGSG